MRQLLLYIFIFTTGILSAQTNVRSIPLDSLPSDLPLPTITTLKNPADGYIFAAVPYWGTGGSYLVMYNNQGRPVFFKNIPPTSTDFKLHENGLLTYFDAGSRKFFALDSTFAVIDSFWVQNGFTTDEHDIKFLRNGNVLLIGYDFKFFDMSQVVPGGDRNASVVVDVVQELDKKKTVVFEWKAYEHYKLTDVGPEVTLTDPSFLHSHINSIDLDLDSNLVVSARNLDEITKIDRKSGNILWRLGGKNNQFKFVNDSIGFSAQHSASILPNGNLILFDNGLFHVPQFSRAVEYKLDAANRTATLVWSYRNNPDVASIFWGNAQRLKNGNTFIGWGKSDVGATEVDSRGEKVFEMSFPTDVFSYRVFRFPVNLKDGLSNAEGNPIPTDVHLEQNFPNPFNGSTVISYELPALSYVSLIVYDLLGREVAVLAHGEQAPGLHTALFAPKSLPSGIFVYRLQTGNISKAVKMLYLK
ncbi:MAG: aryl-sulfate sulfotransferase [Ignavibacteriales bacterium]|nr:aryl-sulfate sulfotransferase [Ignavibacteriales bacterium]